MFQIFYNMDSDAPFAEESDYKAEFMEIAFNQAQEALEVGEVPIGCCFVDEESGEVIARGRNEVNLTKEGDAKTLRRIPDDFSMIYRTLPDMLRWWPLTVLSRRTSRTCSPESPSMSTWSPASCAPLPSSNSGSGEYTTGALTRSLEVRCEY